MTALSVDPILNEIPVAIFCGGIGGFTSGAMESMVEYGGEIFKAKILCSIDADPVANLNHDLICGEQTSVTMDLFTRDQYIAWHGQEPPEDWEEVTPWDIWQAFGETVPFLLFSSPPCKGLSALLPKKSAESKKYQALNELVPRTLELGLRACLEYGGKLPAVIQLENVPRIQTRGKDLLKRIAKLLKKFGYAVDMRADHNLGEVGGLGQNRMRFQIMSRDEAQVPNFIYYPPKKRLLSIGEVIGPLPMPGDTEAGGPLHRLPNLQWKTWVRLALIPAGGDWRDLQDVPYEQYRIMYEPRGGGPYGVQVWDEVGNTVTGQAKINGSNGCAAVSDPRIEHSPRGGAFEVTPYEKPSRAVTGSSNVGMSNGAAAVSDVRFGFGKGTHTAIYRVCKGEETGPTVTGAHRPNNGAISVADPNLKERRGRHPGVYRIVKVDEPGPCVTGTRFGSGAIAVADPKVNTDLMPDSYGVHDWDKPGKAVRAAARTMNSPASISDPRTNGREGRYTDQYRVRAMDDQAGAVTGVTDVQSGAQLVADVRFGCKVRSGTMGVVDWNETSPTVSGSADVYNSSAAVADPRPIPADNDRGVWLMIAEDGTWHRPLTTFELAMLQGFPSHLPDGRPFQLEGCSDAKSREYIGNAYPKPAAKASVNQVLLAAAKSKFGEVFEFSHDPVWVSPIIDELPVMFH